jgi:sigma-B regulation protein RsbU (phosphoserine phosphatase)
MFITAFYLTMDLDSGDCSYASAGHDPQYRVSSGGVEELMPTGLPLGLLEGFELDVGTFTLAGGESVVLFTDGVINVKTSRGRLGEEPFVQLLSREVADTSQILTERILVFLDRQGQMDDDAVVLVLRRTTVSLA